MRSTWVGACAALCVIFMYVAWYGFSGGTIPPIVVGITGTVLTTITVMGTIAIINMK